MRTKTASLRGLRVSPWWIAVFAALVAAAATSAAILGGGSNSPRVLGERFLNAATGGNGNGNNGNGNGNGGPVRGGGAPGKAFTLTVVDPVGGVAPGAPVAFDVRVDNPNAQKMTLTRATGEVTGVSKSGCLSDWFHVQPWAPPAGPTTVPGNGHIDITMILTMDDLVPPAPDHNQDVCKTTDEQDPVTISFELTGTGQQA